MKKIILIIILFLSPVFASASIVPTAWDRDISNAFLLSPYSNDFIGINTTTPISKISVSGGNGVISTGVFNFASSTYNLNLNIQISESAAGSASIYQVGDDISYTMYSLVEVNGVKVLADSGSFNATVVGSTAFTQDVSFTRAPFATGYRIIRSTSRIASGAEYFVDIPSNISSFHDNGDTGLDGALVFTACGGGVCPLSPTGNYSLDTFINYPKDGQLFGLFSPNKIGTNTGLVIGSTTPSSNFSLITGGNSYINGKLIASSYAATSSSEISTFAGNVTMSGSQVNISGGGTGFRFSSGNLNGFSSANIELASNSGFHINGDVGINRANTNILEVNNGTAGSLATLIAGRIGVATTSPYAALSVVGEAVARNFTATSSNATSTFQGTAMAVGNSAVGIGVSNPALKVEILGNIAVHGSTGTSATTKIRFDDPQSGSADDSINFNDAASGSTSSYNFMMDGNVLHTWLGANYGVGSTSPYANLSVEQSGVAIPFTVADQGTSTPHLVVIGNGFVGMASTTPGSILGIGNGANYIQLSHTSTSTFSKGINLNGGCFAINSTCLGSGGGSGTVSAGLAGQLGYYNASGTTIQGTSTNPLYVDSLIATSTTLNSTFANKVGVGTSSPWAQLSVEQNGTNLPFIVGDNGTTSPFLVVSGKGFVGVGTTSPYRTLSVNGQTVLTNGGASNTTLSVIGNGDGGNLTRAAIEWYDDSGRKMGSFSDDGSGSYGLFSINGFSNLSSRIAEWDVADLNGGGDRRVGTLAVEQDADSDGGYAFNFITAPSAGSFNNATLYIEGGSAFVGVRTNMPAHELDVSGDIYASGDVCEGGGLVCLSTLSDRRVKTNINNFEEGLKVVNGLSPVTFNWTKKFVKESKNPYITSTSTNIGLIAQEVKEVFPQAVLLRKDGKYEIDYVKIVPVLIEAIKEQQTEIDLLKIEINALKNK